MTGARPLPRPWPLGYRHLHLVAVDSTNAEAMRRANAGEDSGLWISAEQQTVGKGRSGREWSTGEGNLAASLLLRPNCDPARAGELSLVSGISVFDAVATFASPELRQRLALKWPNDLMIGAAKVGGILIESAIASRDTGFAAVVGVGLNLATHPDLPDRPATSLAAHGISVDAGQMMPTLASAFAHWLGVWNDGMRFAEIRIAWLDRSIPVGRPISINPGKGLQRGTFAGLDAGGALLLADAAGTVHTYTFGDVSIAI